MISYGMQNAANEQDFFHLVERVMAFVLLSVIQFGLDPTIHWLQKSKCKNESLNQLAQSSILIKNEHRTMSIALFD